MKAKYIAMVVFFMSCVMSGCTSAKGVDNDIAKESSLIENTDEEDETEEQTRYVYEEPSLETNEVYDETYAYIDKEYTETAHYVDRYPDVELQEIEGFKKDAYGNYVITEEMFIDKVLPINKDGVIEYVSYYDENGIMVNPMPTYYNNYLQYFASYGG